MCLSLPFPHGIVCPMIVCRQMRKFRRRAWRHWLVGHDMPKTCVVLTTLNAAMQRIPARSVIQGASFRATVGQRVNETDLRQFLVRMGFSQSPTVMEPGDYAIRGGIIDIFPPGPGGPVRLDFFGDILDGARRFDPDTTIQVMC
jgi:transcription-repair coupling factor (superfamily II helicase)